MTDQSALTLASLPYDFHQLQAALSDLAARLDRCDDVRRCRVTARQLRHLRRMLAAGERGIACEVAHAIDRVEAMEPAPF